MAKRYKVVVNMVKGEQAIDLAVQQGQVLRIWAAGGANYLLQATDEQGAVAALGVKAKRVGKDLQLLFDGTAVPQVVLIGYYEVALQSHTPLLGRMSDGSLREYVALDASGDGLDTSELREGGELAELSLINDGSQTAGAVAALAPLAAGPGAVAAALGGLAAAGGGGGGGGTSAPALTPAEAFRQLQTAARDNTAKGLAARVYETAGVSGVSDTNLAAINDVLNTPSVTDTTLDSQTKLQNIVDAYAKVLKAADHIDGNTGDSGAPSLEDYSALTLSGLTAVSAKLLSDAVDGLGRGDVDTVAELQMLADAASAVLGYTKHGMVAPTVAQINSLLSGQVGQVAVTDDALVAVQNKILANNTDSNGAIVGQSELLSVVSNAMNDYKTSLDRIKFFAQYQLPAPEGIPTVADYVHVGTGGVSESNRLALNDALATDTVDGTAVSTPARLQAVIDAYNAILEEANGPNRPDATIKNPTKEDYRLIGAKSIEDKELALLNDAVGAQEASGADTIIEINNLVDIVKAIQTLAAGQDPAPGLRVEDFSKIGLTTTNLNNNDKLAAFRQAIKDKNDDGSDTNSLSKLQTIIDSLPGNSSASPVVLDVNGDGSLFYTRQLMGVTGDGCPEHAAWAVAQDGSLVRDAHGNGVCDAGELHSLSAPGITAVELNRDGVQRQPAPGLAVTGWTHATRSDVSHTAVADAAFNHSAAPVHLAPNDGAQLRLDLTSDRLVLNLANLRDAYGDVHELRMGSRTHNTLQVMLSDVLMQAPEVSGDAGTVALFIDEGQTPTATPVLLQGLSHVAFEGNHNGQVDLLIQSSLTVQVH